MRVSASWSRLSIFLSCSAPPFHYIMNNRGIRFFEVLKGGVSRPTIVTKNVWQPLDWQIVAIYLSARLLWHAMLFLCCLRTDSFTALKVGYKQLLLSLSNDSWPVFGTYKSLNRLLYVNPKLWTQWILYRSVSTLA